MKKLKWTSDIDPSTIPDSVLLSERGRRNASKRGTRAGTGSTWSESRRKAHDEAKTARNSLSTKLDLLLDSVKPNEHELTIDTDR